MSVRSECKELVLGYPAVYKSFKSKDKAMEYLGLKVKEDKTPSEREDKGSVKKPKKKKGKNQEILKICLDKDLYESFKKECERLDMSEDMIIKNMIKEWLE